MPSRKTKAAAKKRPPKKTPRATKAKPSWCERNDKVEEKIHDITPDWEEKLGKGKILIPNPAGIEDLIRKTRKGQLLTNDSIRERLASDRGVRVTAAIPTGIYLKLVALAAEEELELGFKNVTPYWRVLKPDGCINLKFPGGAERQIEFLEAEGHQIDYTKKKSPRVIDFEKRLKV